MNVTTTLTDVGLVTTSVIDIAQSAMTVFLQPPLIIFVGIAVGVITFNLVKRLLRRK